VTVRCSLEGRRFADPTCVPVCRRPSKPQKVQQLLMWLFDEGVSPDWINVRNKGLIRSVGVVHLRNCSNSMISSVQAASLTPFWSTSNRLLGHARPHIHADALRALSMMIITSIIISILLLFVAHRLCMIQALRSPSRPGSAKAGRLPRCGTVCCT
jgi:hypothetical protein